ncbi:hypothetical protein HY837_06675, partial [archaeon]|nr:hypothetical protein [archaeon]
FSSSCATVKGTLGGAVSYPHETIDNIAPKNKVPKNKVLLAIYLPFGIAYLLAQIPIGSTKGFFYGIQADVYDLENGKYPPEYESMRPWMANYDEE